MVDTISALYHASEHQHRTLTIVHLVRHSLNFCSWKDRKSVAADLRRIYEAATAELTANDWMLSKKNGPGNRLPSPQPGEGRGRRGARSSPSIRQSGK